MKKIITFYLVVLTTLSTTAFAGVDVTYNFRNDGEIRVRAGIRPIESVEYDYILPIITENIFQVLIHDEASIGRSAQYCSVSLTSRNRGQYMDIFNSIVAHRHEHGLTVSLSIMPTHECGYIMLQQFVE